MEVYWGEFITVKERLQQLAVEIAFLVNAHMYVDMSILENRVAIATKLDECRREMEEIINGQDK